MLEDFAKALIARGGDPQYRVSGAPGRFAERPARELQPPSSSLLALDQLDL